MRRRIQWIPPNAPPLRGKEAIAKYLAATKVTLEQVDVDDVFVGGSNTTAYLTSTYHTRFCRKGFPKHKRQPVLICGSCANKLVSGV
jgi:hypothetical protein